MNTWRDKAHKIIAAMSKESYLQANLKPNGTLYKRHRPYAVPQTAETLIECLKTNDEERAKALFCWDYEAQKAFERLLKAAKTRKEKDHEPRTS